MAPFPEALANQPAPYPHARCIVDPRERSPSPGVGVLQGVSEVLERSVTPEAHMYFRRIVQVTQSELEKLLVYKVQQIFDPVQPARSARFAVEELGVGRVGVMGVDIQLPGIQVAASEAAIEGRAERSLVREPYFTKDKTIEEGRHLTKYVVGIVARIIADFNRFAETVLRWQRRSSTDTSPEGRGLGEGALFPTAVSGPESSSGAQSPTEAAAVTAQTAQLNELVDRLERQNKDNTDLECKYSSVAAEQRDNRRAFLRERFVWKERMRRMQLELNKHIGDRAVAKLLEHDVQFYAEGEVGDSEDVDSVREKYEQRLADMLHEHAEQTSRFEKDIEQLEADL